MNLRANYFAKRLLLLAPFGLMLCCGSVHAADYWIAKAFWHFDPLNRQKAYAAKGPSKASALAAARHKCSVKQPVVMWGAYCRRDPARIQYTELEDCGTAWSVWKDLGRGVGNPCPSYCFRGAKLQVQVGIGATPSRPLHRDKFQCWRKM